ncbi:reverse transcriptase [Flavipsychrobacter stenotrophus]|uniref:Reverse transcriptase n=1 Tax=Flavipsychrobacter stenotrophus TaxID=2077091 RepID=A0A2S7SSI5_9BACT|nr:RNA-directed DNA polymerase [Flavipsychrobacter stenotrophus]PQJ09565.1 reverse transcriptase [Flavipsychrobacter stenotrophus]
MKRINNIYEEICSVHNLEVADMLARKRKRNKKEIIAHDANREDNILAIHRSLVTRSYHTSKYVTFKITDPKERIVSKLPYYPDRIVHHAIMVVLEPVLMKLFTADTYSCITGRGIHGALKAVKKAFKDKQNTQYCLKLDIRKFYPSIDHDILKALLRRKIKDADLLWLLDEIIDSAEGLPIGNYLSQFLANFYLSYFDHWLKEVVKVKYYFRYADDLVILSSNKNELHRVLALIREYMECNLNLEVKDNYQVFPIDTRGLDFVGYKIYHSHTLIRKSIKKSFARMMASNPDMQSIAAYKGWLTHADGKHLEKKLTNENILRIKYKKRT